MKITKTVPVTIEVLDSDLRCCGHRCRFCNCDTQFCEHFEDTLTVAGSEFGRRAECLTEFGMGEE